MYISLHLARVTRATHYSQHTTKTLNSCTTYQKIQVHILTSRAATEVAEATERSADRARERDAAILELQQLRDKCSESESRMHALDRETDELRNARRDAEQEARDADARAKQAQDMAQRENERLQLNLTSASGQLSVLMETLETLQKGGGAEQAAAQLSARMSACMSEISQLQLNNSQLHHWLEDRIWQCGQLEAQMATLRDKSSVLGEKLGACKAQNDVLTREVHALKAALSAKDQELHKALRTQDRSAKHAADMDTELAAYRKALDDERARHLSEIKQHEAEAACDVEKIRHMFAVGARTDAEGNAAAQSQALQEAIARVMQTFASAENGGDIESRLREIMAECAAQVEVFARSKTVLEWELKQKTHRIRILTGALDASISSQRLAEQQLVACKQRLDMDTIRAHSTGWARAAANEQKIEVLSEQLESAVKRSIDIEAQCARFMQVRGVFARAF
jgi:hypothetical protein